MPCHGVSAGEDRRQDAARGCGKGHKVNRIKVPLEIDMADPKELGGQRNWKVDSTVD